MSEYLNMRMHKPPSPRDNLAEGVGFFQGWVSRFSRHRQRRRMIATLERLDDRTLDDIGLCRGDIRRFARNFDSRELGMSSLARSAIAEKSEH